MEIIKLGATPIEDQNLKQAIIDDCGVQIEKCYQCGKCTAGCPVAFAMDKPPNEIMRLLQLGLVEETLKSKTIWLCASCDICSTRCPREIDLAKVMETLRIKAKDYGYIGAKKIDLFHRLFLQSVEKNGRVYEMGLIMGRNILGLRPFQDVLLGPSMFLKGKISPLPHTIKDNAEISEIFAKVRKKESEK